jgi:predicted CoA-binding protein
MDSLILLNVRIDFTIDGDTYCSEIDKKRKPPVELKDDPIFKILSRFKRITIVGLSPDPNRPSHSVAQYLIDAGYEVEGVRPHANEILEMPCYDAILDMPEPMQIVCVFRASEHIPQIVDEIIEIGAKVLWLPEGVTHPEAENKARKAGIFVISNRCIKKEHQRVFQGKNKEAIS